MLGESQVDELFKADQRLYDDVRNTLAGIDYPDPKSVETQAMKAHFDWEKDRFNSLQMLVESSFKYLNEYNDQFVRIGEGRNNSLNVREAELQNTLEQLQRFEQRLDELEKPNQEEEKNLGVRMAMNGDALDRDPFQIAHDQKKKRDALLYSITDTQDERINHINMHIQVEQMKSAQKEVGSKKHVEEIHDAVFKAVIESVHNRKFQDKSQVKKYFKDDRYIRHVLLRRKASTLSADIIADMEEAIKAAENLEQPVFLKHFVKCLVLMVREAKDSKELRQLERQISKEKAPLKTQLAEPAQYNYADVQALKAKIKQTLDFIQGTIEQIQMKRENSDLEIQREQQEIEKLREEYGEVHYEHKDAQDIKRAPKQRSLSKIPIQNQRSSLVTEEEGGEASVTNDIKMEGPEKGKKSGGFFACCGFS